jgi:hypothetical protein
MSKASLQDAMSKAASRTPFGHAPEHTRDETQHQEPASEAVRTKARSPRPKGREGKKVISGFFDKEVSRQLSRLAIDQDRTNEDLLREAINDLFAKYHLPNIA